MSFNNPNVPGIFRIVSESGKQRVCSQIPESVVNRVIPDPKPIEWYDFSASEVEQIIIPQFGYCVDQLHLKKTGIVTPDAEVYTPFTSKHKKHYIERPVAPDPFAIQSRMNKNTIIQQKLFQAQADAYDNIKYQPEQDIKSEILVEATTTGRNNTVKPFTPYAIGFEPRQRHTIGGIMPKNDPMPTTSIPRSIIGEATMSTQTPVQRTFFNIIEEKIGTEGLKYVMNKLPTSFESMSQYDKRKILINNSEAYLMLKNVNKRERSKTIESLESDSTLF